ncbi:unnamed protein product, partial [Ectocarpus sp. 8 AP-2014]
HVPAVWAHVPRHAALGRAVRGGHVVLRGGVGHQGLPAYLHLHRVPHSGPLPAEPCHHARVLLDQGKKEIPVWVVA